MTLLPWALSLSTVVAPPLSSAVHTLGATGVFEEVFELEQLAKRGSLGEANARLLASEQQMEGLTSVRHKHVSGERG